VQHKDKEEIEERQREEEAVDQIKTTADAGERAPGILCFQRTFEQRLGQITRDTRDAEQQGEGADEAGRKGWQIVSEEMKDAETDQHGQHQRAADAFPGLLGTDIWEERSPAKEAAAEEGSDIGELRHRHDKEDKVLPGRAALSVTRREIEQLRHEEKKPGDVDHAEEGENNRLRRGPSGGIPAEFTQEERDDQQGENSFLQRKDGKLVERLRRTQQTEIQSDQHNRRPHAESPMMGDAAGSEQGKVFPERTESGERDEQAKHDLRVQGIGRDDAQPKKDRAQRAGEK